MISFQDLSRALVKEHRSVLMYLLPAGKFFSQHFKVGSVLGEAGDSLVVELEGPRQGLWYDFATGVGGDLLELWKEVKGIPLSEVAVEVKQFLHIEESVKKSSFLLHSTKKFVKPPVLKKEGLHASSKQYLTVERCLTEEVLKQYRVSSIVYKGEEIILFPYWVNGEEKCRKSLYLERVDGKKKMLVTKDAEPCLFGWQALSNNCRSLVLVEGEIDAMSLFQYDLTLSSQSNQMTHPLGVLSVLFGGGGKGKQQWVEHEFERLQSFDKIYLALDDDEEGRLGALEIAHRLGRHRCFLVQLPHKDANECLQKGVSRDAILQCFNEAKSLDPSELNSFSVYTLPILEQFLLASSVTQNPETQGFTLPWPIENSDIRLRPGELSLWTGINGHGKSQLLGQIVLNSIQQGAIACIASLEMNPVRLGVRLYRQASGLREPSLETITALSNHLDRKLFLFDHLGNVKPDYLLEVFEYGFYKYGINTFVIDSLMKCGFLDDDYNAQKRFVDKLCDFKNKHTCHIHLVTHPRKGLNETYQPGKMDIKGSGALTDLADNCFSIFRKPDTSLDGPYDSSIFSCLKQRNGEWTGQINLYFNKDSYQFLKDSLKPDPLISF